MIMLADEGEFGHACAVHEAIGKLLTSSNEPPEARRADGFKRSGVVPPSVMHAAAMRRNLDAHE